MYVEDEYRPGQRVRHQETGELGTVRQYQPYPSEASAGAFGEHTLVPVTWDGKENVFPKCNYSPKQLEKL